MDWKSGISIEACRQLQVQYGPDFNMALDHWRKEVRRTQKVIINGVTFFIGVVDEGWYFVISTPLDPKHNLYQVWGPLSLVGALSLMGVGVKGVTIDDVLWALINAPR